jgi:hypothetical protein
MINSFWKAIPVLSLAMGVVQAQDLALQELAQKDKTMTRGRQQNVPCGVVEGNNCYARACPQSRGGAFEFDFLWWRAENQGFVSAWEVNNPIVAAGTSTDNFSTSAKVIRPNETWAPGFRIGAGWNTEHDRWDVFTNWTWYRNKADATTASEVGAGGLGFYSAKPGVLSSFEMVGPYTQLRTTYRLWHNCFDLELARAFYITRQVTMRPHWGVRGAINKQKGSTTFFGGADALTTPVIQPLGINDTVKVKNVFWGVGPRTGLHTNFYFGKGFSVVGRSALSLLYGQMKWRSRDQAPTSASNLSPRTWAKSSGMFQTLVPNLQMFLGLEWSACFNCEEVRAGFAVGWEANYWWNQYAVNTPPQNWATNNALTMEGVTVNVHVDF